MDNGQRRVISYIDGRMNTGHWIGTTGTQFTGLTNVIFGLLAHQGVTTGSVAYDNIKIWNLAKTNFSDRFTENAGDLRRTLSIVNARGEAVPENGSQTFKYGDLIAASVPSIVTDEKMRYVCTGAIVDGNDFTQDGPADVTLTLTNNAALTWQWQAQYLIEVTTNGLGTVTAATGWYADGASLRLIAAPSTGWLFDGWEGDTGGCEIDGNTITVAIAQSRSISARFIPAIFSVTFNPQGGTVTPVEKTVTYGSAYGDLSTPVRPSYIFEGWWTGTHGGGTQIDAGTVVLTAADHTIYAKWAEDPRLCPPEGADPLSSTGSYDGCFYSEVAFDGTPASAVRGTLSLTVSSLEGRLTAKAHVQKGNLYFRTALWSEPSSDGVRRAVLTTWDGEVLDLYVGQNRIWGTLAGGSLEGESLTLDGVRNRFADRADGEAQTLLNSFRGYYTVALPIYNALSLGEAKAAPEGSGYLTLTVGDQGKVTIAGVLADGTKVSHSSRLLLFNGCGPEACVPFFAPLYSRTGYVGGLLWLDPDSRTLVTDRDLGWFVRWEKPGAGVDGFSELLDACGGFYSPLEALAAHYLFSAQTNAVPYFHSRGSAVIEPVFPADISVAVSGTSLTITKGAFPIMAEGGYDYSASENSSKATLMFQPATGIFKGSFRLYYDYMLSGRLQHKMVSVPYAGVLAPVRATTFDALPAGQGYYLVPDTDPAFAPYRLKRSYLIELDAAR